MAEAQILIHLAFAQESPEYANLPQTFLRAQTVPGPRKRILVSSGRVEDLTDVFFFWGGEDSRLIGFKHIIMGCRNSGYRGAVGFDVGLGQGQG